MKVEDKRQLPTVCALASEASSGRPPQCLAGVDSDRKETRSLRVGGIPRGMPKPPQDSEQHVTWRYRACGKVYSWKRPL